MAGTTLEMGGSQAGSAKAFVNVRGGKLTLEAGIDGSTWALAGITIRPRAPQIGHLSPQGARAEQDLKLTATATAPDGIRSMQLRYRSGGEWQNVEMNGDGTAFQAVIPAKQLGGETLEYSLAAEDTRGGVTHKEGLSLPIIRAYQAPRILQATGPATWKPDQKLSFEVTLENEQFARELVLHYREADQNRSFRRLSLPAGHGSIYTFELDPQHLDGNYELIYYFEVCDRLGSGTFYPDPFTEARYRIIKPLD